MTDVVSANSLRDSPEVEGLIESYFAKQLHDMVTKRRRTPIDELPLARVKRIMKQDSCDPHPRMISAEATPFMGLTAQLFIGCLTEVAWTLFTQKAKRNTLQLKDLKDAVAASSKFDFLVDIVDMFDEQKRHDAEVQSRLESGLGVVNEMLCANQQHAQRAPNVQLTHLPVPEQGRALVASAATGPKHPAHEQSPAAVHSALLGNHLSSFTLDEPPQSIPCISPMEANEAFDEENLLSRLESLPQDLIASLDVEFDENELIAAALGGDDMSMRAAEFGYDFCLGSEPPTPSFLSHSSLASCSC